jgi:hypothetical protein
MASYSAFFSSGLNASRSPSPSPFDADPKPSTVVHPTLSADLDADYDMALGSAPSDATNTSHARSRSRSSSQSSVGKTLRKRKSSLTLGSVRPTLAAIKSPSRSAGTAFSKHITAMSLSLGPAPAAPSYNAASADSTTKNRMRSGSLGGALRPRRTRTSAVPLPAPTAPLPPLPPLPTLGAMVPGSAPSFKSTFTDNETTPKRNSMLSVPPSMTHRPRSFQGTSPSQHPGIGSRSNSYQTYTSSLSYQLPSVPSSPGLPSSPMRPDSPVHPNSPSPNEAMTTPEKKHLLSIPVSSLSTMTTPEREKWGRARAYSIENNYRICEDMEI